MARFLRGIALLLALASPAWALAPTPAVIATPPQPQWKELSLEQQKVLAPLVRDWDQMENFRRKKWLGIAGRYQKMKPQAQQLVQKRMQQWAAMTPEQRAKVRSDYKAFSQLPPEKKAEIHKKWQSYSNLPAEDKARLKRGEKPAPKVVAPIEQASPALSSVTVPAPVPVSGGETAR